MTKVSGQNAPSWGKLLAAQERDPTYAFRQTGAILRRLGEHLSSLGDAVDRGEVGSPAELGERLQHFFELCRAAQTLFARMLEARSRGRGGEGG
jgi:hypothetical protein